jgi:hypothetical protein
MSTLKFARELAQFEEHLAWLSAGGGGYPDLDSALAASYKALIAGLVELDEHLDSAELGADVPRIPDILAQAMAVFHQQEAASSQSWQNQRQAREAEYDEAVRQHELAITVECPYCGAQPGTACRTTGPSGAGHPKGVHDTRTATVLPPTRGGSAQLASWQEPAPS